MPRRIRVCASNALPPGQACAVGGGPERIAVFNVDGRLYACSDACPHAGAPLHQGVMKDTTVTCCWHGWSFQLAPTPDAPPDGLWRYPVVVDNGTVYVEVED